MKRLRTFLIVLVFACAIAFPSFAAEGNVTYSGNAGDFIFQPGSKYSPTDLFANFKDVMPGDTLTQSIVVKNNATKRVRISMRALGAHEDSVEFLSQLKLYVEQVQDTPLFEAPADQTAQLTEWRELGVLSPGAETELVVGLEVPVTLDNQNKNQIGYLDWEFVVEELDDPKTGDDVNYLPWIIGIGCSAAIVVFILVKRHKDSDEETR